MQEIGFIKFSPENIYLKACSARFPRAQSVPSWAPFRVCEGQGWQRLVTSFLEDQMASDIFLVVTVNQKRNKAEIEKTTWLGFKLNELHDVQTLYLILSVGRCSQRLCGPVKARTYIRWVSFSPLFRQGFTNLLGKKRDKSKYTCRSLELKETLEPGVLQPGCTLEELQKYIGVRTHWRHSFSWPGIAGRGRMRAWASWPCPVCIPVTTAGIASSPRALSRSVSLKSHSLCSWPSKRHHTPGQVCAQASHPLTPTLEWWKLSKGTLRPVLRRRRFLFTSNLDVLVLHAG